MITVRIATTPAEIEAALRLRYEVFYEEEGDARYADHARRLWCDRDDGPQSHLIIAEWNNEQIIGTLRITVLREWLIIGHDAYALEVIANQVGLTFDALWNTAARMDRVVVKNEHRGGAILRQMQKFGERIAHDKDCSILVGAAAAHNPKITRLWKRLGWNVLPHIGRHKGFEAQVFYK